MNDSTVLSHIYLCESLCYSSEKIRPSYRTERSKFLSSLALILNGNASCTAVYVLQGEQCVLISRNGPIAATDERYFNGFFRLIRIYANLCFNNHQQIAKEKNQSEEDYVQFLFDQLAKFITIREQLIHNKENPTDHQLPSATELATILYSSRLFQFMLNHLDENTGTGSYYFEKISAHDRSLQILFKCLHVRTDYVIDLYKNITWKLISSIETIKYLSITPRQAFENIFTYLCHLADGDLLDILSNMKSETFYDKHLLKLKRIDNNRNQSVHIHAEILLINHLLNMNINETNGSQDIEIGISKMPCLLCWLYMNYLNK
ncbi:hypothetical protein I4U23_031022 [Adineta vaga]|nr:hypothetical protein I4U23_031022 [Adineta vaga]